MGRTNKSSKSKSCGKSCGLGCAAIVAPFVLLAMWSHNKVESEKKEQEAVYQGLQNVTNNLQAEEGELIIRLEFIHFSGPKNGYEVYVSPKWDTLSFQQRAEKTLRWYQTLGKPNMYIHPNGRSDWHASVNDDGMSYVQAPGGREVYKRNIRESGSTWTIHQVKGLAEK